MLSWLRRRRERIERIGADAEALIRGLGVDKAFAEARRRGRQESGAETAAHWSRVSRVIARRSDKHLGLDTATRMALDANFTHHREALAPPPRASIEDPSPIDELRRINSEGSMRSKFRVQFRGVGTDRTPAILEEVDLCALDPSQAIREVAHIAWPRGAIGFRLIDLDGHEVFRRHKADRQDPRESPHNKRSGPDSTFADADNLARKLRDPLGRADSNTIK
jgi:hypothetical protein